MRFAISLGIYLLGIVVALFLQKRYSSIPISAGALLIAYIFAYFARRVDPNIEYEFARPVKYGRLISITFVLLTISIFFLFLYFPRTLNFVAKIISPLGTYIP